MLVDVSYSLDDFESTTPRAPQSLPDATNPSHWHLTSRYREEVELSTSPGARKSQLRLRSKAGCSSERACFTDE